MTAVDEMQNADELFEKMDSLSAGYPAADVVYAVGRMLAVAIMENQSTADVETTLDLLRDTINIEMAAEMRRRS